MKKVEEEERRESSIAWWKEGAKGGERKVRKKNSLWEASTKVRLAPGAKAGP